MFNEQNVLAWETALRALGYDALATEDAAKQIIMVVEGVPHPFRTERNLASWFCSDLERKLQGQGSLFTVGELWEEVPNG